MSTCSPWQRYQQDLKREDFLADEAQANAVRHMQDLHERVLANKQAGGWRSLKRKFGFGAKPERGLYFWGGVGRGKTYLMDCFYECLPIRRKRRVHFHRFMEEVHDGLKQHRNESDPLIPVAEELAAKARVLCFDEFFVSDIADAMILAVLLRTLFENGVTLVATSNIPPKDLYREGLQRAKFLPAIDLLETHTQVVNVDGGVDYRLRILERAEIYHWPLDEAAQSGLCKAFRELAPGEYREDIEIEINHRLLPVNAVCDGIVWFEFSTLCEGPRSTSDYIEIARRYNTVLIGNARQMNDHTNDPARRFINLVDEFYDRGVNLILSAETAVEDLYTGKRLAFEFERTKSRLTEMQTHDYLAGEHQP